MKGSAFRSHVWRLAILTIFFAHAAWISVSAQTLVTNPRTVEFDPSEDHSVTVDGRAVVERYSLDVYMVGAAQPFHRVNMGKPAPQSDGKIRFDFGSTVAAWPLPGGTYEARVAAIGPAGEGVSDPSNPFTLASCGYSLSGAGAVVVAGGGGGAVGVTTTAGCGWTATSGASWITMLTGSGTGSGTASYSVAANTTGAPRSATLSIAGQSYRVDQQGTCAYTISSAGQSFAAAGGSGSVGVSAGAGCGWTAASSASWVTVSPASGTAAGTVTCTVGANTGGARTATLTIAGRAHTVSQAGATVAPPPGTALPTPWRSQDIGSVGLAGSASHTSGQFTVAGAGADIWGGADSFQFVSQPLAGDGQIVARVTGLQNTNAYAKAGIMLREALTAGSRHVVLDVRPGGAVEFMARAGTGGSTAYLGGGSQAPPAWLKLVRTSGTVTASISADGTTWRTVGSTTVSMGSAIQAGLAVTSHDTGARNTATFDNVAVTPGTAPPPATGLPSPWRSQDVGSVGVTGSAAYSSGRFTVMGAGADIWGAADAFHYVYQPLSAMTQIVARVTALQNTNAYAKAGIMLRDGVGAAAAHVILDVRPGGSVEFMKRSATGVSTAYLAGSTQAVPTWLRLVRSGTTVTASVSADGTTWRTVGATSVTLASPQAGLVVTSHDRSRGNTATFDNVSVR